MNEHRYLNNQINYKTLSNCIKTARINESYRTMRRSLVNKMIEKGLN